MTATEDKTGGEAEEDGSVEEAAVVSTGDCVEAGGSGTSVTATRKSGLDSGRAELDS